MRLILMPIGKQQIEVQDISKLPVITTDAQAALTAIARRKIDLENEHQYLDLSVTNLTKANLVGANLNKADFRKVKNLSIDRIKQAENWMLAIYDPEIEELLKVELGNQLRIENCNAYWIASE